MTDRDPYAEGREARDTGKSQTANPYDPDLAAECDAFMSWNDGWMAADEYDD